MVCTSITDAAVGPWGSDSIDIETKGMAEEGKKLCPYDRLSDVERAGRSPRSSLRKLNGQAKRHDKALE